MELTADFGNGGSFEEEMKQFSEASFHTLIIYQYLRCQVSIDQLKGNEL